MAATFNFIFTRASSALTGMDEEKARAYAELASKMTELHASIALLTQNVDKMARTDAEVTSMTKIFQGVFKNASEQSKFRES